MLKKTFSKILFFFFLVFALYSAPCTLHVCYALTPGTTAAQFLKIAPSARAVSMGEAFVALADDASALFWNPAGLTRLKQSQITYMHSFWFQGITCDYLGYAQYFDEEKNATFGCSALYLNAGDIERTLEDASGNYTGTGGNFSSYDVMASISSAWKMFDIWSFGATVKFLYSTIDDARGSAFSSDFGILLDATPQLSLGANLQNMIVPISMRYYRKTVVISEVHPLPMNTKIGACYKFDKVSLATLDVNIPSDNNVNVRLGGEYLYGDLAFRVGYKTDFISGIDILSGLCAGVGLNWKNLEFDYAFVPYGDLGLTHRISALVKF